MQSYSLVLKGVDVFVSRGGRNVENQNIEGSERQKYF